MLWIQSYRTVVVKISVCYIDSVKLGSNDFSHLQVSFFGYGSFEQPSDCSVLAATGRKGGFQSWWAITTEAWITITPARGDGKAQFGLL